MSTSQTRTAASRKEFEGILYTYMKFENITLNKLDVTRP